MLVIYGLLLPRTASEAEFDWCKAELCVQKADTSWLATQKQRIANEKALYKRLQRAVVLRDLSTTKTLLKTIVEQKLDVYITTFGGSKNLILQVINCESGYRHENIWGDNGMSYGVAQFQKQTFYDFMGDAGWVNMEWKSMDHQLQLIVWAFSQEEKYRRAWSCYRKLTRR